MAKGRLFLFHWNHSEAEAYAAELRKQDWVVDLEWEDGARGAKAIKDNPPEVVVFNLNRLPSHSLATAEYLQETKSLRHIPLVFVDGDGPAFEKVQKKVPAGIFVLHEDLESALEAIIQG